jgi:hypothetical protein
LKVSDICSDGDSRTVADMLGHISALPTLRMLVRSVLRSADVKDKDGAAGGHLRCSFRKSLSLDVRGRIMSLLFEHYYKDLRTAARDGGAVVSANE